MEFKKLKNHIIDISNTYKRFGDVRIYRIVLDILGSQNVADDFMTSDFGGFTQTELNCIKSKINYIENRKA